MSDEPPNTETAKESSPEEVAVKPEETAHDAKPHDDISATVAALNERVSSLENAVTGMLPQNRDETPVKPPWTHRRLS